MSVKLRSVVVGVGYLGTFHAQKQKNHPDLDLVGVCDAFTEQGRKVAEQLGVQFFESPGDILKLSPKIDFVTVAASTRAHYDIAKLFLSAGISVNVEKPIAASVVEAEELVRLAKKNNILLGVGHIERFNPAIVALRETLKKPKLIELYRWAPFRTRGSDVNVLYDLMIHDIDLMFWLAQVGGLADVEPSLSPSIHLKNKIEKVLANGSSLITNDLDTATAYFSWSHGLDVMISVSRVHSQVHRAIRVIDEDAIYFANTGALTLESMRKNSTPISELVKPDDQFQVTTRTIEKADALQLETNAFVEALLRKQKLRVTGEDGLLALEWVQIVQDIIKPKPDSGK